VNITIIEPHSDDAWINLGGYILKNPDINFKIITVCRDVTNSKNETAKLSTIFKNIETKALKYTGIPWYIKDNIKPGTYNYHFNKLNKKLLGLYRPNAVNTLKKDLQHECRNADLILLPLGAIHPQHLIVSSIELDKPCKYYPEFPYCYNQSLDFSSHMNDGKFIDIIDVIKEKIAVFTEVYQSQNCLLSTTTKYGCYLHQIYQEIIFNTNIICDYSSPYQSTSV
jgi:hypothetical protein